MGVPRKEQPINATILRSITQKIGLYWSDPIRNPIWVLLTASFLWKKKNKLEIK